MCILRWIHPSLSLGSSPRTSAPLKVQESSGSRRGQERYGRLEWFLEGRWGPEKIQGESCDVSLRGSHPGGLREEEARKLRKS